MEAEELHPIYRISGLGRSIELKYPTHRLVVGVCLLLLIAGSALELSRSLPLGQAMAGGLNLSLAAFLAWALLRELTPAVERSAYLAGGVAALTWYVFGAQKLILLLGSLLVARVVSRSPGRAMSWSDTILMIGGLALAPEELRWAIGVAVGCALVLDGALAAPEAQRVRREHLTLGLITIAGVAVLAAPAWTPPPSPVWIGLAGLIVGSILAIALQAPAQGVGDVDGRPVSPLRMRLGAAMALVPLGLSGWTVADPWTMLAAGWGCCVALIVAPLLQPRSQLSRTAS